MPDLPDTDWRSFREPVTRRHLLRRAAGAGIALPTLPLVLAACGGSSGGSAGTPASTSDGARIEGVVPGPQPVSGGRYGGRLVVGYQTEPDSFDPALATYALSYDVNASMLFFGGLLAYAEQTGGPIANLAAMPAISRNGKTLTFRLRGAKFHNGRTITAEDVKWSWERIVDPKMKSWGASFFQSVAGGQAAIDGKAPELEGVEAVDAKTLKVTLVEPDFTFLNAVSLPITAPVPREEVERLGRRFGEMPVGYGPFRIESFDRRSQSARFVRFDEYFYEGLPYLEEVEIHWGSPQAALVQQVKNGAIDLIGDADSSLVLRTAARDPAFEPMVQDVPVLAMNYFDMNTRTPPFEDARVREALNWAVNRENLGKVVKGVRPNGRPFPESLPDYNPTTEGYGFDPERARQLLADAGHAGGLSFRLSAISSGVFPDVAQVMQQDFAAVGVDAKIEVLELSVLNERLESGSMQMWTEGTYYLSQPTPADLERRYSTKGSWNKTGFSDTEVDALFARAKTQFDAGRRDPLYGRIEELVAAAPPAVYLFDSSYNTGMGPSVQNWHNRGEFGNYFDRIWKS